MIPDRRIAAGWETTPTPGEGTCALGEADCAPEAGSGPVESLTAGAYRAGTVRAVLFWMEGCPHCETVRTAVVPLLEEKYAGSLEVLQIEVVGIEGVDRLYQLGERKGMPKEEIGVPLLMLGDELLSGDQEIERSLSSLVEQALARGGVDFPTIPEFDIHPDNLSPLNSPGPEPSGERVAIYLFWKEGCPHCAAAKPFLMDLESSNERIDLRMVELGYDQQNLELLARMAAASGVEPRFVPVVIIGERIWEGYNEQTQAEILTTVQACLKTGCVDPGANLPLPDSAREKNGFRPTTVVLILLGTALAAGLIILVIRYARRNRE